MRYFAPAAALLVLGFPFLAAAQSPELVLPSFAGLQRKATDTVDIKLGPTALWLVGWLAREDDGEGTPLRKTMRGLKSVQVRSYKFDSDFAYDQKDIDAVRAQLAAPGWSPLATVRNRAKHEDVDVYIAHDEHRVTGIAICATKPREFTIVNLVGAIDLAEVSKLEGALGLKDVAFDPAAAGSE